MASRRLVNGLVVALVTTLFAVQGCANQGEGERCDLLAAGDSDCDDGLQCVSKDDLTDPSTDRCCPPESESFSDSRCARGGTLPTFTGGTGGTDATGGTGGTDVTGGTGGTDVTGGTGGTGEGGVPAVETGGMGGI